jgi:hypothetical protein
VHSVDGTVIAQTGISLMSRHLQLLLSLNVCTFVFMLNSISDGWDVSVGFTTDKKDKIIMHNFLLLINKSDQ